MKPVYLYGQQCELPDTVTVKVDGLLRCGECGTALPRHVSVPVRWETATNPITGALDLDAVMDAIAEACMKYGQLP